MSRKVLVALLALWSIPPWLVMIFVIRGIPYLLGFVLVWFQAPYTRREPHPRRQLVQFSAWWMWLWGNNEDGVDGLRAGDPAQKWWADKTIGMAPEMRVWLWSARRNPANNMRYVPLVSPKIPVRTSRLIGYVGTGNEPVDGQSGWAFCWYGPYTGLYIKTPTRWFWVGWKIKPSDASYIPGNDTRRPRYDFALQFQKVGA